MADTLDLCGPLAGAVGYTYKLELTYYQASDTGPVMDLTGWTGDWEVHGPAGQLIRISTTDGAHGQITIDGPAGVVSLQVDRAHMLTMNPGLYSHELRLVRPDSLDVQEVVGSFVIESALIDANSVTEVP